jgi:hypothetical protein
MVKTDTDYNKTCTMCKENKPLTEYCKQGKYLRSNCKQCQKKTRKQWNAKNPDYKRKWRNGEIPKRNNEETKEKICRKCKIKKIASEFSRRSSNKKRLFSWCKKCSNAHSVEKYIQNMKNENYKTLRNRDLRENRKKRAISKYEWLAQYKHSRGCIDCGEKNPLVLQFDHMGLKEFNISNRVYSHGIDKLKIEIEKTVVRCGNCHKMKTGTTEDTEMMKLWNSYKNFAKNVNKT